MKNKKLTYIAGTIFLLLSAILLINTATRQSSQPASAHQISFTMPKNLPTHLPIYLPIYNTTDTADPHLFAAAFGITNPEITQTPDFLELHTPSALLRFHNALDYLEYIPTSPAVKTTNTPSDYLHKFFPQLDHAAPIIISDENNLTTIFPLLLNGLPNHAHSTIINTDHSGNLLSLTHYFFNYEPIDHVEIITIHQAISLLPPHPTNIISHSLIYDFAESILQPMHLFQTKTPCGNIFEHIIPAAKFNP